MDLKNNGNAWIYMRQLYFSLWSSENSGVSVREECGDEIEQLRWRDQARGRSFCKSDERSKQDLGQ